MFFVLLSVFTLHLERPTPDSLVVPMLSSQTDQLGFLTVQLWERSSSHTTSFHLTIQMIDSDFIAMAKAY